jgi:hypothetical protein
LDPQHYDHQPPQCFYFEEVASALEQGVRRGVGEVGDVDLLERARNDGWKPQPKEPEEPT